MLVEPQHLKIQGRKLIVIRPSAPDVGYVFKVDVNGKDCYVKVSKILGSVIRGGAKHYFCSFTRCDVWSL